MNVSLKRWVKILLIIATIPLLAAGVLYYVVVNNLKDVLQYAIEKQSKGAYAFHSDDLKVSIWDKIITIDNSVLSRKDTVNVPAYYDIKIHKAYLSIESWQELIQHKRASVDSLTIVKPEIVIHDYRVHEAKKNQAAFQTSMILDNLQQTLDRLHAKSIKIQDASFALFKRKGTAPFMVNNINLDVKNFLKIDNNDKHLFGSDNIELLLGRQHWLLADGRNTLSFSGLRFSSATQLFEIDSVVYHKPATAGQGETSLQADKFFLNSSHLPAIYQKGELLLDTLICIRPVLNLPLQARKKEIKDTTGTIHSNIKSLFRQVNIRYAEIKDGEIILAGEMNAPKAGTKKANLTIHNLTINPQSQRPLTTDSIKLNLNNIAFYSKDSLFKISVSSFSLLNKDVLFKNVLYGPASQKMVGKGMTFTAPALRLENISLDDLMRKRLVASDAELVEPKITLIATRKAPSKPQITANHDTITHKKTDIYQTLHSFGELIQVDRFHIINGSGHYNLAGNTKPVNATLTKLNATIYVKELLASDALIKIKHAIADLRVHEMNVAANGLKLQLLDYRMDGAQLHNWVDKLQIDLANGTSLIANKIYWEAFSWDVLQQTKVIQIDLVRVRDLLINAKIKPKPFTTIEPVVATAKPPSKGLPKLRIGRLLAEHLNLKAALPKETLAGFQGQGIQVDKLTTDPKFFRWARFLGNLNDLYLKQAGGKQISVAKVALHSHEHTTLTNIQYADNQAGKVMNVSVPTMQIKGPFPSTDFSNINLTTVQINRPELTMVTEAKGKSAGSGPAKAFSIPLNLALHDLKVNQARLNVITKKGKDSTRIQTLVDVEAKSLHARKHEEATFASISVSPADVKLALPKLNVAVPAANVTLTGGKISATKDGKPSFQAHLLASLIINDLHPTLASKKKTAPPELHVKSINGNIDMPNFHWTTGQKMAWPMFVQHTNLAVTDLSLKSATTNIKAQKVGWEYKNERLHLDNFQIIPAMTREEFMTPPHLQSDYITLKGERVEFNGIKADRWYKDSTLVVNHIVVKNLMTDVSRDKRLPDPAVSPNKLMPTQLISKIKVPFHVDSVSIFNSTVLYNETSKMTNRVGTIPLKDINGTLKNITNHPTKSTDSLKLLASTKLLGLHIKRVHYRESYGDSLSGFHMLLKTSDLQMRELTQITNPMASADIDDGYLRPITARIAGNKYASVGYMRFHYKDLKLRLLGHKDSTRRSLLIKFENFAVAKVLRKKNDQDARIFYDRDQKKFIFGYWIKSIMSGVLTSLGVKGNKKYHANYLKLSQKHTLPAEEE